MKRFERKARLKAMKAAQKEAKRQKREEALNAGSATGSAGILPALGEAVPAAPEAPDNRSQDGHGECSRDGCAPVLLPAYGVTDAVNELREGSAAAREAYKESKLVTEEESVAMLSEAARTLSDVIGAAKKVLAQVSPDRLKQAVEVLHAEPVQASGVPSTGSGQAPQQRPRRGTDPLITLLKLVVSGVSLLQRVLYRLHPKLKKAA